MKTFVIEAYGGKESTDGAIVHFTVSADSAAEAVEVVQRSSHGLRYDRFDVIEEIGERETEEPGIIAESEGPYRSDG